MYKLTYLVLCAVTASLSSNDVNVIGPLVIEDVFVILLHCAKKYNVSEDALQEVASTKNFTIVDPCLWGCALRKTGFIDEKGQYILYPGLTYVREFSKHNKGYAKLESIVKYCKSVKKFPVRDGEAGCERGALAAQCFATEIERRGV